MRRKDPATLRSALARRGAKAPATTDEAIERVVRCGTASARCAMG